MQQSNKPMRRLWLLYGAFVSIVLLCTVLFFMQLVGSEDSFLLRQGNRPLSGGHPFRLGITDLPCPDADTLHTYRVAGLSENGEMLARVSTFDVAAFSDREDFCDSPLVSWAVALQVFSMAAMAVIVVLVVLMLLSVHRAISSGRVFLWRRLWMLRTVGVLMLLMTLAVDTSLFLERRAAFDVLQPTDWVPQVRYTIHFTRIFFALLVLFVAELLYIGRSMQQEQDLTI